MKTIYNLEIKAEYRECSNGCGTKRIYVSIGDEMRSDYTTISKDTSTYIQNTRLVPLRKDSNVAVGYSLNTDDLLALLDNEPFGYFDCGCKEKKEPEIKPCPNCDCESIRVRMAPDTWSYVQCGGCFMTGPHRAKKEMAIDIWNDLPRKED